MDLCGKSSGFSDFENTVDRGLAVKFGMDSGHGSADLYTPIRPLLYLETAKL